MAIFPNIKVVEGNAFSVLVPLKVRTFESCRPIDEDIDPTQLDNVVFKFGGVSYTPVVDERGVSAVLPATLARGTYDIVVTADYGDNPIRAAYEGAVTIVPWNSQSDAQQYLPGSPIVLDAAYIIGGALTDAELEQLKQDLRDAIADERAAQAAAEAAKEHYDELAEQLSGVAQESSVKDGSDTTIGMLKDATNGLASIKSSAVSAASNATFANLQTLNIINSIGTPETGQPSTLFAAIAAGGSGGGAAPKVVVPNTTASQELEPNTLYIFPNRTSNLVLTLGTPLATGASEYHIMIEIGSTIPTITMPTGLSWKGGTAISFDTDKTYEVSILENYAIYAAW